jgi:hypothetical protein
MPPLTDEQTRRNVIRQWILGFPQDTIAEQNNIDAGTVSSIVASYKVGLEELDFDSIRQLAVEARQHGWNLADLASHARLYNYFVKSGQQKIRLNHSSKKLVLVMFHRKESSSLYINYMKSQRKNQFHLISYIKQKLEEKQKIDEQIKEVSKLSMNTFT